MLLIDSDLAGFDYDFLKFSKNNILNGTMYIND